MRLLLVNSQFRLGGAETVVRQLWRGFPSACLAVADSRKAPREVGSLYPRALTRLHHSRFHPLVERVAPRARWTDRAFRKLAHAACDVLHLHNFHGRYATSESLSFVARARPIVWTFHALWGVTGGCDHPGTCRRYLNACGECPQLGRWPLSSTDNTSAELSAKLHLLAPLPLDIIAPSRWLAEIVRASPVGRLWRVHHIPNAVDADFCAALKAQQREAAPRSILIVNRNFRDDQKGFPLLKEALDLVAEQVASLPPLILVGENSDWAGAKLAAWKCESHGYVSDLTALARLHRRANTSLFASPAETFPCVVLEAMAAGHCVVATPSGGVVEQIEHGVCGLLATDISGAALGAALVHALRNPELRVKMAAAAHLRTEREFKESLFIERHRRLYAEVVQERRAPL